MELQNVRKSIDKAPSNLEDMVGGTITEEEVDIDADGSAAASPARGVCFMFHRAVIYYDITRVLFCGWLV